MSEWLSLLNYSAKYEISLSTLRRRIKNDSILFKLDNGKYFIKDEGIPPAVYENAPRSEKAEKSINRVLDNPHLFSKETLALNQQIPAFIEDSGVEISFLASTNRLVEDLKSAYAKILQEKEEQISQLKEEIGDLRMLVRIMEQQAPLKSHQKSSDDIFFGEVTK